jgi:hypothetical protein
MLYKKRSKGWSTSQKCTEGWCKKCAWMSSLSYLNFPNSVRCFASVWKVIVSEIVHPFFTPKARRQLSQFHLSFCNFVIWFPSIFIEDSAPISTIGNSELHSTFLFYGENIYIKILTSIFAFRKRKVSSTHFEGFHSFSFTKLTLIVVFSFALNIIQFSCKMH